MDRDQIRQRDLHRACIHEYAHAHVARHHGIDSHVRIADNPDAADDVEQKFFSGKCHFLADCQDPTGRRQIGLAGLVAEHIDDDADVEAWMILESLELDPLQLSESDGEYAGIYTEADLNSTAMLIRRLWDSILVDAAREMMAWQVEVAAA